METNQIPKGNYCELKIAEVILPENCNPREKEMQGNLFGLRDSFEETGQLNPVTVNLADGKYYVVAGRRRLEAAKLAGQKTIEAKVYENLDYKTFLLMLAVENIHRRDFNAIEQARLMAMMHENGYSERIIAGKLKMNVDTVRRKMNLLNLTEEVQRMITRENNALPVHQAGLLTKLSPSAQLEVARKAAPITGPVAGEQQVKEMVEAYNFGGQKKLNLHDHADPADKRPTLPKPDKKQKAKSKIDKSLPKVHKPGKEKKAKLLGEVEINIVGKVFDDGKSLIIKDTSTFLKVSGEETLINDMIVMRLNRRTENWLRAQFLKRQTAKENPDKSPQLHAKQERGKKSGKKPVKNDILKCPNKSASCKAREGKKERQKPVKNDILKCPNKKCKNYGKTVDEGGGFICVDPSTETTATKWECIECGSVFHDNTNSKGKKVKSA